MSFRTETISRKGGRATNQDFCDFVTLQDGACWAVADGLGGHMGGQEASKLAVETILDSFRRNRELSPAALETHLNVANQAILDRQATDPILRDMRTTAVVLITDYKSVLWAHAGDTRLYYFQGRRLLRQTRDHSVPQILADAGDIRSDQIRGHQDKNRLLRALGSDGELQVTVLPETQRLYRDDALLICVDGFWEYVLEAEMESDLAKATDPGRWLSAMESRLLARAAGQNNDNYTAVAIYFSDRSAPTPPSHPKKNRPPRRMAPNLEADREPISLVMPSASESSTSRALLPLIAITVTALAVVLVASVVLIGWRFTVGRSATISAGPAKKMMLPRGWVEVADTAGNQQQNSARPPERDTVLREFQLRGAPNVRLYFVGSDTSEHSQPPSELQPMAGIDQGATSAPSAGGGDPPDPSALPNGQEKQGKRELVPETQSQVNSDPAIGGKVESALENRESLDPASLSGMVGKTVCDGTYEVHNSTISRLNGRGVLIVEGSCREKGLSSYVVVLLDPSKAPSDVREIVYEAPASEYKRYLNDAKQMIESIEW